MPQPLHGGFSNHRARKHFLASWRIFHKFAWRRCPRRAVLAAESALKLRILQPRQGRLTSSPSILDGSGKFSEELSTDETSWG
jgi:hypothetical protein